MPSWPAGATLCTVTLGPLLGSGGTPGTLTGWLELDDPARKITHSATGTTILSAPEQVPAVAGNQLSFTVPHVNQSGFVDGTGAAITMWGYTLTVTAKYPGGKKVTVRKNFQPLTGTTTLDLDTVPDGSFTPPVQVPGFVTTVAGVGPGAVSASALTTALEPNLSAMFAPVITPEKHGAAATYNAAVDDTAAVVAAFAAATALREAVIGGNVFAPGATVLLKRRYNLSSLAATIVASCNIDGARGRLIAPAAFAGAVLTVGHETSGQILQAAHMDLPSVTKTGATSMVAGSAGVKVQNLQDSVVNGRRIDYFETAWWLTGLGQGTAYNEINLGRVDLCKVAHKLVPQAGGWVNQNVFKGGGVTQSPNALDGSGIRRTGWRHVVIDGSAGAGTVNGNTFDAVSYEGDLSELYFDIKHASNNVWTGSCRFEQGTPAVATTLATDTFASTGHGLAVGDMVVFFATVTRPEGMDVGRPYWISNVPDANSFKVAATKGGITVSFSTNGSGVVYYSPPRIQLDGTGNSTYGNVIREGYYSYPGPLDVRRINRPYANTIDPPLPVMGDLMPGRNRIINGNFQVNQRAYASAGFVASGVYCFDRWKSTTAGTTLTFTAAPQGQAVILNAGSIAQVVERANLEAGPYTLSWKGGAQAQVYKVGDTPPGYAASPITIDLDGTGDVTVEFIGPGRVAEVQLERGIVATPFERRHAQAEAALCKRYFQRYGTGAASNRELLGTGIANAATSAFFPFRLPVEMRTTPTASATSGTTFRVNIGTSVILASGAPTLDATSNARTLRVNVSVAAGLTTGQAATLDTGDGLFDLSAEL